MSQNIPITDFETVLTTTRAVRRRLDFSKAVPLSILKYCLEIATQAPTGGDAEDWRFIFIGNPETKSAIAAEYARIFDAEVRPRLPDLIRGSTMRTDAAGTEPISSRERSYGGAAYLAENIGRSPWLVVACATRPDNDPRIRSAIYGSVFPAVWSFQLALRSQGLGSVITTLHLRDPRKITSILRIPENVVQCALLPVAYTKGADFKRASRKSVEDVAFLNHWDERLDFDIEADI